MNTGFQGTFVIAWAQTEVDGLQGPEIGVLRVGASWRWSGVAVRVDGPQDVLILNGAEEIAEMRRRAARMVQRLVGAAVAPQRVAHVSPDEKFSLPDQSFVVTDGRQSYVLTIVPVPDTGARLLMVVGETPPHDSDLWVVRTAFEPRATPLGQRQAGGVICFTPGTRIRVEGGQKLIETLRQGDRIQTRDNGLQEVLWTGQRRMTGARLYAMPGLRPIRFRAGALGVDRPREDLLVSPQHRMLLRGPAAQALFSTDEVLVAAEDLLNDLTITVDHDLSEVTYIHILLPHHNILWANGVETESFHPSNTAIDSIDATQRAGLLEFVPHAAENPHSYGDYARRNLSASEAAILRYELAA
jgi:hypothetical protein